MIRKYKRLSKMLCMLAWYFLYLLSSRKKVEFQSRIDGLKQYMELRSVENKLQGLFHLVEKFLVELNAIKRIELNEIFQNDRS